MEALFNHILLDAVYVVPSLFVFVFFCAMVGWAWPLKLADKFVRTWGYHRLTFDEQMAVIRHRSERDAK